MKRILTLLIMFGLLLSLTDSAAAPAEQYDIEIIRSYQDIPGVTEEEIAAIESLKEAGKYFSYGALVSTMAFTLPDGSYGGFTPRFCRLLSSLFGIEFKLELQEWDDLTERIDSKSLDFTGELTATSERMNFYYMSHPIAEQSFSIYTHENSKPIHTEMDLEGLRVGFLKRTITENLIHESYSVDFDVVMVETHKAAVKMLENGEIDAFVELSSSDPHLTDSNSIQSKRFFSMAYGTVSLTTANPDLQPIISVLDKYIVAGGIDKLFELYQEGEFEYSRYKLYDSFTEEERAYLKTMSQSGAAVRVGHEVSNYPYSFYNKKTQAFEGIAVDVLTDIGKFTGLRFESASTEGDAWADIFERLDTGEIPMVGELLYSEARKDDFLWAEFPYAVTNYALLSKVDYPDLTIYQVVRAKVGIVKKTAFEDIYYEWFPNSSNTINYDTADEGFEALKTGEIDLLMMSGHTLLYQTHYKEELGYKINVTLNSKAESFFGFNKNEEILCSVISKAQGYVNTDSIETIWTTRVFDYSRKLAEERAAALTWFVILLLIVLIITISLTFLVIKNKARKIEALADDRQRLGALVAVADAGIIVKDANGIVQEWNIGAESILGYKPGEIVGKTTKYYAPESAHAHLDEIERKLQRGESIVRMDVVRKHKDGRLIDCSASYTPYFDSNGYFSGAVAIFHDISEKKQMEQALRVAVTEAEEASKVKSTFLANMSHEIRTPMNAVIGMADLLLSEELTLRQRRYAGDIKTAGVSLLGIINDILDFSKIESGKLEIIPVDYDFIVMLENMDSMFTFMAHDKQITYLSEKGENLPRYLLGDDLRMRQILTNLLSNAVKFTSEGYVKLAVRADKDFIYIDVSDTGSGIKGEDIEKLFIAFQQLDAAVHRTKQGTGLGLSVTKSLIDAMGGTITVESEYGKGSVFHVCIPRVDGSPNNIQSPPESCGRISAPEAGILVVDDFEVNRNVTTWLLRLFGIECDTAPSGEAAIDMIQKKHYDIVFMDHMLPGMDGVETTQRIREMGYDKERFPIIALTANAVKGVKEMLIEQGMNDFLSKPINKMLLGEMLVKWLPPEKVCMENNRKAPMKGERVVYDEKLLKLQAAGVVDMGAALGLMGGSEVLYKDTVHMAVKKIPSALSGMDSYLRDDNLIRFAVEIHSIKNMLATIGAKSLSKEAADMETWARSGDMQSCKKRFSDFAGRLSVLGEKLGGVFMPEPGVDEESTQPPDPKVRLEKIISCLEDYDDNTALDIGEDLARWDFGTPFNEHIKELIKQIEIFEFENAKTSAFSLLGHFGGEERMP